MHRNVEDSPVGCFFYPRSLAIIGSFREGHFGGFVIARSLMKAGYEGAIFPVNPGYKEVHGLKVYPSIRAVPEKIDIAIVMINAKSVSSVLKECGDRKVGSVILVSDGFAERDEEGARLQSEISYLAKSLGVRILGPNTAGVVNTANGFNPCPYEAGYYKLRRGVTAVCAQTGMINPQAYPYPDMRFGVSKICDLGNKCDVDECDLLDYLAEDRETGVISMYLESVRNGPRFLRAARRAAERKPLLVMKAGKTEEGAEASRSHTGSLAVDDRIFDAACVQSGILRLQRFNDVFEMPKIFAAQKLPSGNRVAILTVTGGVAVAAIDECAKQGLSLSKLAGEAGAELERLFVGLGKNPVDLGPMMAAVQGAFDLYPGIVDTILGDKNVDALFTVLWATPAGKVISRYVETYEGLKARSHKPVVTWIYGPDAQATAELSRRLEDIGFPVYNTPEKCIRALGLAYRYGRFLAHGTKGIEDAQPGHFSGYCMR
ncbi:MAG: CoA-binding protein [Deltaproteobacteria bacterium]|nr:CoA-binding protein [Deltaproteobacteria bacterium]